MRLLNARLFCTPIPDTIDFSLVPANSSFIHPCKEFSPRRLCSPFRAERISWAMSPGRCPGLDCFAALRHWLCIVSRIAARPARSQTENPQHFPTSPKASGRGRGARRGRLRAILNQAKWLPSDVPAAGSSKNAGV